MAKYLLSTYAVEGATREPMSEAQMREMGQRMSEIEKEMKASGAWFFSGRLHDPNTATVVKDDGGTRVTTDGPFTEAKEHIAGFYIIEESDLDAALEWAAKVTACINAPIEVWPFQDAAH